MAELTSIHIPLARTSHGAQLAAGGLGNMVQTCAKSGGSNPALGDHRAHLCCHSVAPTSHTGVQRSGLPGLSACSLGPPSLSAVSPPSPQEENQALPSLLRGGRRRVVGEIMILSSLLPLGRQVLEKNQVCFGFPLRSLHIPPQDKFSQPSL